MRLFISVSLLTITCCAAFAQSVYPTPQRLEFFDGKTAVRNQTITVKRSKKLPAQGYVLRADGKRVVIEASTARGEFYARQTLAQLTVGDSVQNVLVNDFPAIKFRGSVEGFYGKPWSHVDRLSQLRFYGKYKLNTYIYGPKDDPYHSSPNWRKPYPEVEAQQISELARVAAENYVDFVWAIHPGGDIKWNDEDFGLLLQKFNLMYDLGVRSFALFFDDISGEGTNAHKQAELLNKLNAQFVKVKGDVTPLIMCPTEYNKSWADPSMDDSYLVTLGREMDRDVQIMWTGDMVCADITDQTLDWINARIGRECYIWWNFPVTDYVRHLVLQGPSYGLTPNGKGKMQGFVSNPMENAEASKIALFGVADYTWNPSSYNYLTTWEAAIEAIMPQAADAYRTFAIHSADIEKNGHGYRRDESWMSDVTDTAAMYAEFARLTYAPAAMRASGDNAALLAELEPWLVQAELLGRRGMEAIALARAAQSGDAAALWMLYNSGTQTSDQVKAYNTNKVGTLVLAPYIERLRANVASTLLTNPISKDNSTVKMYTNVEQLKAHTVTSVAGIVSVAPILEQVTIQPQAYVGVEFTNVMNIEKVAVDILGSGLKRQFSQNGTEWQDKAQSARFIKFINDSDKPKSVRWNDFEISVMPEQNNRQALVDGDLRPAFLLDGELLIEAPADARELVVLCDMTTPVELYRVDKNGTKEYISTSNSYLRAPVTPTTAMFELRGKGSKICETVWMTDKKN